MQLNPVLSNGELVQGEKSLQIIDSGEVTFMLSAATSFNGYNKSPSCEGADDQAIAQRIPGKAEKKSWKTLHRKHVEGYRKVFSRVSLEINPPDDFNHLPTEERLVAFQGNKDPALTSLLFQYDRYLMTSGSRAGGQPLNLQGIWNDMVIPPWNSGYTININTEMNYWPAEVTNPGECHEPLFRMIGEMAETGRETVKLMFDRRG